MAYQSLTYQDFPISCNVKNIASMFLFLYLKHIEFAGKLPCFIVGRKPLKNSACSLLKILSDPDTEVDKAQKKRETGDIKNDLAPI